MGACRNKMMKVPGVHDNISGLQRVRIYVEQHCRLGKGFVGQDKQCLLHRRDQSFTKLGIPSWVHGAGYRSSQTSVPRVRAIMPCTAHTHARTCTYAHIRRARLSTTRTRHTHARTHARTRVQRHTHARTHATRAAPRSTTNCVCNTHGGRAGCTWAQHMQGRRAHFLVAKLHAAHPAGGPGRRHDVSAASMQRPWPICTCTYMVLQSNRPEHACRGHGAPALRRSRAQRRPARNAKQHGRPQPGHAAAEPCASRARQQNTMRAHTHTCMRMHAHTYTCMHAHTRTHTRTHGINARARAPCMPARALCTHARNRSAHHARTHAHAHAHACTHVHMHARTHTHTHTHAHTRHQRARAPCMHPRALCTHACCASTCHTHTHTPHTPHTHTHHTHHTEPHDTQTHTTHT